MTLAADGSGIVGLSFGEADLGGERAPSSLTNKAATQLQEYLAGRRKRFDLPLEPEGTAFQLSVWQAVSSIPYGQTRSYSWVADRIGKPRAARAVGMANNRNPLPVFIPCHRVIGASGKPAGYAGGLKLKEFLLDLERRSAS